MMQSLVHHTLRHMTVDITGGRSHLHVCSLVDTTMSTSFKEIRYDGDNDTHSVDIGYRLIACKMKLTMLSV